MGTHNKSPITEEHVNLFSGLFSGLKRAFGLYKNSRAKTLRDNITVDNFKNHFNGVMGVGVVPINEENKCYFGVIDIDIDTIDHKQLIEQVEFFKLPLLVCRSKSGGAHLYTFTKTPIPAKLMRNILSRWASELGYGTQEIFPKQDTLMNDDVGNWINLPYFDIHGPEFKRYVVVTDGDGIRPGTLDEFLTMATQIADTSSLGSAFDGGIPTPDGMPPCLAHFYHSGVSEGGRNEVLYSMGVYGRKSDQTDLEDFMLKMNYKMIDPPLPLREIKTLVASVKKQNYRYKCKHPMFKEHCNPEICKQLLYGIGEENGTISGGYDEHMVGCLTKHMTQPVRWVIDINGIDVDLNSEELMNYQRVRVMSMERANIIIPPMKQEDWLLIVKERLSHVKIIEAPEDASTDGDITQVLTEFVQIAERGQNGKDDILRGIPARSTIMEMGETIPVILFRSQDLLAYIKRRKINNFITNNILWMLLRKMGIGHTKIRVKSAVMQVWYVKVSDDLITPILEPLNPSLDI